MVGEKKSRAQPSKSETQHKSNKQDAYIHLLHTLPLSK